MDGSPHRLDPKMEPPTPMTLLPLKPHRLTAIPARCVAELGRVERVLRRWQRSLESDCLVLATGAFSPVGPGIEPAP